MEQQQFQPTWTREQTKSFASMYQGRGHLLPEEDRKKLEIHSEYHNVPFYQGEADITSIIKQASAGVMEGFTASIYKSSSTPDSWQSAIARKAGHLVGFAPGILSPILSLVGGSKGRALARTIGKASVPMLVSNAATKRASKLGVEILEGAGKKNIDSLGTVGKFLIGGGARNVAHSAFHLGVASSVGSWRDGIDGMWQSFMGGAVAGGAFGVIGEIAGPGAVVDIAKMLGSPRSKVVRNGEIALKAFAGSMFQGLSAQAQGGSTPELVYEYLLGAYFGGGSQAWKHKAAQKFQVDTFKKMREGTDAEKEVYAKWQNEQGTDVEKHPEFYNQPKAVQEYLKTNQEVFFSNIETEQFKSIWREISKRLGFDVDKEEMIYSEDGFVDKGEYKYIDPKNKKGARRVVKESDLKEDTFVATTGSEGDATLATVLGKYGIPAVNYVPYRGEGEKVVGLDRKLDHEQLSQAYKYMAEAAENIVVKKVSKGGKVTYVPRDLTKLSDTQRMHIAKNFWAMKQGKVSYIVSQLNPDLEFVPDPAVQWALEFGKLLHKDMYLYNIADSKLVPQGWYKWKDGKFAKLTGKNKRPPKPPKAFSIVGGQKLANPAVSLPEFHSFFGSHFKKRPIVEALQARDRSAYHDFRKQIKTLESGRHILTQEYAKLQTMQPSDDVKIEMEALEKGILENQEKLKQLQADAIKEGIKSATREDIQEENGEAAAVEDNQSSDTTGIGKRALRITTDFLERFWGTSAGNDTPWSQREARINITKQIEDLVNKYMEEGSTTNRSEELVDALSEMFKDSHGLLDYTHRIEGTGLSAEDYAKLSKREQHAYSKTLVIDENGKRELRQYLTRLNQQRPVIHYQGVELDIQRMKDDANPITRAGNRKMQQEPMTVLESTFNSVVDEMVASGALHAEAGEGLKRYPIKQLDHTTITNKDGGLDEMSLSRLRDKEKSKYKALISNVHKTTDKVGEYIYGGVGDKDKLFIVKYHPQLDKIAVEDILKFDIMSKEEYGWSLNEATNQGIEKEHHDKILRSNILYDMSMNGTPIDGVNLKDFYKPYRRIISEAGVNIENFDEIVKNATDNGAIDVKNVWLVGSTAKKGKGKDVDILYEFKDTAFPPKKDPDVTSKEHYEDWFSDFYFEGDLPIISSKYDSIVKIKDTTAGEDLMFQMSPAHPDKLWNYIGKAKDHEPYQNMMEGVKVDLMNPPHKHIGEYITQSAYDNLSTAEKANYDGSQFIQGSKAFNKRAQIWFSPAFRADAEYIRTNAPKGLLNKDGEINYMIIEDFLKKVDDESLLELESLMNSEHMDGGILVIDKLLDIMNNDAGKPRSGQNKSFIVSPDKKDGAFLGKYMMHNAGKKLSEMMAQNNISMLVPLSTAKQRGWRTVGEADITDQGILNLSKGDIYELKLNDIKYSSSTYGNDHFFEPTRLPKQVMFNMLQQSYEVMDQDIINQAFEDIIGERWVGEESYNVRIQDYLDKAAEGKSNENEIQHLMNNIEKIGIPKIVEAIRSEHAPELTEAIYQRMLKVSKENMKADLDAGELTPEEVRDMMAQVSEFNSLTDRVIRIATDISEEAAANGHRITADSIYNHKFIRDFRARSVQNFLVNSATKPKLNNSGAAFMRPYDIALQNDLDGSNPLLHKNNKAGINHNEELFLLDNYFKRLPIHYLDKDGKRVKKNLGKVWDLYTELKKNDSDGEYTNYIKEVLRAGTVRVPMDSVSGLRVLEFGGFTGRDGHGVLLHSRVMRALGGADLDGDKAFFFFGGEGAMSSGMKEQFYKNKSEFERIGSDNKSRVKDSKQAKINQQFAGYAEGTEARDLLVISEDGSQKMKLASSANGHLAPTERIRISEAAVDGRNQLGPAVSQSQLLKAAFNSIIANGGTDKLTLKLDVSKKSERPNWKTFNVTIKARDSIQDKELQRDISRAQLGLASDPMDEAGLKGIDVWKKLLWDAYFDVTEVTEQNKKGSSKYKSRVINHLKSSDKLSSTYTNSGVFGAMSDINGALWGKDYRKNRSYSMNDIHSMTQHASRVLNNDELSNSFLPKLGHLFSGVTWHDSIYARVQPKRLEELYAYINNELSTDKELQKWLERSTLDVTYNNYVKKAFESKIWDFSRRNKIASNMKEFDNLLADTRYSYLLTDPVRIKFPGGRVKEYDIHSPNVKWRRLEILEEFSRFSEDALVNDISDMVTLQMLVEIKKNGKISPRRWTKIAAKAESLKQNSYLMLRNRTKISELVSKAGLDAESIRLAEEISGIKAQGKAKDPLRVRTAELDQAETDNEIKAFRAKEKLNDAENLLFDQMLLGSMNKGKKAEQIERLDRSIGDWNDITIDLMKSLRWANSKTSISRLGFSSLAIPDHSIRLHLKRFMEMMNNTYVPLTEAEQAELASKVDTAIDVLPTVPFALQEKATHSGWAGVNLESSPKSKEAMSIATDVAVLLKSHPDIVSDKSGRTLNELMRGLDFLNKDVDAMGLEDMKMLRNYLKIVKKGTVWQRLTRLFGGDEKKISFRSHQQLPDTTNRELIATDIQLIRKEGFFSDAKGIMRRGDVQVPTQFMDRLSNNISAMNDMGVQTGDDFVTKFQESQLFYQGLEEAPSLWSVAIRSREYAGRHEYRQISKDRGQDPKQTEDNIIYMRMELQKVLKNANWTDLKRRKFFVNVDGHRTQMTGKEIVNRINDGLTLYMEEMHEVIAGREGAMDEYVIQHYDKESNLSPKYDYKLFLKDMDTYLNGTIPARWKKFMKSPTESIPRIFGIDGIRAMMREMHIDYTIAYAKAIRESDPQSYKNLVRIADKLSAMPISPTGKLGTNTYFPRMFFDESIIKDTLKKAEKRITDNPHLSNESKIDELAKLQFRLKRLDGDYNFDDMVDTELYNAVIDKIHNKATLDEKLLSRWFDTDVSMGNMRSREHSTPGWSIAPTSIEAYSRSLGNTYFRGLANMISREIVSNPKEGIYQKLFDKWGHNQANAWRKFAQLYVNDALGNPTVVTDEMVKDKDLALRWSPYRFTADNRVAILLNKMAKFMGFGTTLPAGKHAKKVGIGVVKFISGGQDGADIQGLEWAKEHGYETGGTAPKGFKTASGAKLEYSERYGMQEVEDAITKKYQGREKVFGPRTEQNVMNSDLTLLFGDPSSPGSRLTLSMGKKHRKLVYVNPTAKQIKAYLKGAPKTAVINIAGNRPKKLAKRYKDGISSILNQAFGKAKFKDTIVETAEKYIGPFDVHSVRRWSQMEARYEMASLLAHPKSTIANMFGGTGHTIQSAGPDALRKVYDYEYLQTINPKLKTRQDVEDMVVRHGVLPQWLVYELGLQKEFQTNQGKEALKALSSAIRRNPNLEKGELKRALRGFKSDVFESVSQTAAKFMTIPERRLRTDSFMAHYINGWQKFGGAIQDPEHPFLIEMGKKGVKATQFLYNAPHRPAFARTALGKILTRFQMYAWNSVKLRGDMMRRFAVTGYNEHSPEGKAAIRFIAGDILMLSLANMYIYSMFDNNLPQPWGWFQDTANWLFGDDKERETAFHGALPSAIAPLQVIMPPLARPVGPVIKAMLDDDWSRIGDYYAWTMFPFGRFARDLVGPGSIREAPIRIVDKMIGLPLLGIQRDVKKTRDGKYSESIYPKGIIGGYE